MKPVYNQNARSSSVPTQVDHFEANRGVFDEKCLSSCEPHKINRIYSNDSNIQTAEESCHECSDSVNQSHQSSLTLNKFQKHLSFPLTDSSQKILQFHKYQSDLGSCYSNEPTNSPLMEKSADKDLLREENLENDSIIMQEERQSNQTLQFQGHNLSLSINSLLKTPKTHEKQSYLITQGKNTENELRKQENCQQEGALLEKDESINEKGQSGIVCAGKEDDKSNALTESRVRKNACLKKKVTLTIKDSSEASFQDEENWQIKSYKKVVFKGNDDGEDLKQSPERSGKPGGKVHLAPKQSIKRGQSIISICLSKNELNEDGAGLNTSLKSSRTLHDLGSNHLIYRLKQHSKNGKEKACQSIEVFTYEEQRREAEIFDIIRTHSHRNILKLHSMSRSIDIKADRTILLQTTDFYPKNLHQYLIDLQQSPPSPQQVCLQRKIILFQVLKGLNFLHSNRITHRNLTPFSVLVNDSLETVIAGFSSIDSPSMSARTSLRCEWLIRPPQIIMQPNFIYTSSGDMWEFGCLAVYMLKREMPFLECCDASLIVEMSKCIGRVTAEDRKAIEFADQRKFIFPNMRRESMGRSFKCRELDLIELLKKVFVFNPYKRATAAELMKSSYFDELRKQVGSDRRMSHLLEGIGAIIKMIENRKQIITII